MGAPQRFSESGEIVVLGNEVFAQGTHRGKEYTAQDLADIVANFERFSSGPQPLVRVPAVLGHEEEQDLLGQLTQDEQDRRDAEFLSRTDLPAGAWAQRVYTAGGVLLVDWGEMAPEVARLLEGKAYRRVSVEIYDEPPEGCVGGQGKMLRRVSFLGGEIPQVKTLKDIPTPQFRERRSRVVRLVTRSIKHRPTAGTFTVFQEVAMDRQQMLDALAGLGYDVAKLSKAVPDEALAEILIMCQAKGNGNPAPKPEEKPAPDGNKMSDGNPTPTPAPTPAPSPDRQPSSVTLKYTEIAPELKKLVDAAVTAAVKEVGGKVERLDKFAEDRLAAEKKATIKARLDALVQQGKVLPAERDAGLDDALYASDSVKVLKFSEGGKAVERTALEQHLAVLEARPALVSFAERMKQTAKGGKASDDEEVARVERFSETIAPSLEKAGKSAAEWVAGFKAAKAKNPKLTAKQYGVPAEFAA